MQLTAQQQRLARSTGAQLRTTQTPRPALPARARLLPCAALATPPPAPSGKGLSYADSGVSIDAGNELVERIKKLNPSIGGFGGLVEHNGSYLVACTDGVGTKLKLAFQLNKHDTIGQDLVAMSVNDAVCLGARPMFFLDYFACGKLDVDQAEAVVKGIVDGCKLSDCILLGGETAEMPGMYSEGEYDLAGFAVGTVEKDKVIDGKKIQAGDVMLGMASSGIHSNGYSLVRKVLEVSGTALSDKVPWADKTFGEVLLEPTHIYVRDALKLAAAAQVNGFVHMTGGGFPENLPRVVPKGLACKVDTSSWEVPHIFQWLQKAGGVSDSEMFRTFNMGVGMVAMVPKDQVQAALSSGVDCWVMGEIVEGQGVIME